MDLKADDLTAVRDISSDFSVGTVPPLEKDRAMEENRLPNNEVFRVGLWNSIGRDKLLFVRTTEDHADPFAIRYTMR